MKARVLFLAGFSLAAHADIGLVFKNLTRAAVYYDEPIKKVVYRDCDRNTPHASLNRRCPQGNPYKFEISRKEYVGNLDQLYKVPEKYHGEEALTQIVQDIETLQRLTPKAGDDVSPEGASGLQHQIDDLVAMRDLRLKIQDDVLEHLTEDSHTVYMQKVHRAFPYARYAFNTAWFDGKQLWRLGPQVRFQEIHDGICGPEWNLRRFAPHKSSGTVSDFFRTSLLLSQSPLRTKIGDGWEVWAAQPGERTNTPVSPNPGEAPVIRLATPYPNRNTTGSVGWLYQQGLAWSTAPMGSAKYVLCTAQSLEDGSK